ncbi:hypothetical protein TYRP_014232 [Tyrophagus putrescentiae]|nr:hypothetical protein TYRP_014232 [Tyrophagus putrescentiae]
MEEISLTEIKDGMEQLSNQLAELTDTVKKLGVQLDRIVSTNGMQQLGGASFGGPQVLQPSANNYPQMPVNQPVYIQVPANNHLILRLREAAFQLTNSRSFNILNRDSVFNLPNQYHNLPCPSPSLSRYSSPKKPFQMFHKCSKMSRSLKLLSQNNLNKPSTRTMNLLPVL